MSDLAWARLLDMGLTSAEAARRMRCHPATANRAARRLGRRWARPAPSERMIARNVAAGRARGSAIAVPIEIDGRAFPSIRAAADAHGIPESTLKEAVKDGTVAEVVAGFRILGSRFRSYTAAARIYGVSDSTVRRARMHGQAALDAAARRWRAKQLRRNGRPIVKATITVERVTPMCSGAGRLIAVSVAAAPWEVAA